jgi:cytidylate kinase
LGYIYIDTGAMYRSVALRVKERGISPKDKVALHQLALSLRFDFVTQGGGQLCFCEGDDVTEAIRTPEISRLASFISKQEGVREALVRIQREMGKEGGVILEGRDIGTVVFPDADKKMLVYSREYKGDKIIVEVEDDGKGIDPAKIKEVAIKKGIITQGEADVLSDQDAIRLIFRYGFTTKEHATELAGRGIGMDVVEERMRGIGGNVEINSSVGKGAE